MKKHKLLVILGPTASGKSDLAVELARTFGGEVISADSRQVYKGMDIGTGKITKKEMRGIPHHLLDVASPKTRFTVSSFQKLAKKKIEEISKRGKLPILCGGTGFYIQAIVDSIVLPEVKPNATLRTKLAKKSVAELGAMLKKLDPVRAKNIDLKNPARLIRAIEIATELGSVPALDEDPEYDTLQIGIRTSPEDLRTKISTRLKKRIKAGMIAEVKKLRALGVSWKRLDELGLEYRYVGLFVQGLITKDELMKRLENEIVHYAKRQMTWFKRDERIGWFALAEKEWITKEVRSFLSS